METWDTDQADAGTTWTPRAGHHAGDHLADRAGAFLQVCQKNLAGPSGADCRAFLRPGVDRQPIKAAGLGWNMADALREPGSPGGWNLKLSEKRQAA